jgi:hypothetical protein
VSPVDAAVVVSLDAAVVAGAEVSLLLLFESRPPWIGFSCVLLVGVHAVG